MQSVDVCFNICTDGQTLNLDFDVRVFLCGGMCGIPDSFKKLYDELWGDAEGREILARAKNKYEARKAVEGKEEEKTEKKTDIVDDKKTDNHKTDKKTGKVDDKKTDKGKDSKKTDKGKDSKKTDKGKDSKQKKKSAKAGKEKVAFPPGCMYSK